MFSLTHWLLLRLPPEMAHDVGVAALRIWQWLRFRLFRAPLRRPTPVLLASCPRLKLSSRIGLAAGFDKNAEVFAGLATLGFGFIEVGTVTPVGQPGNKPPRLWRKRPDALVNAMGFNNCGLEAFKSNIERYRTHVPGVALFANIGKGRDTPMDRALEDYESGVESLRGLVDGFVVNVSSPNTPGLVSLQSAEFVRGLEEMLSRYAPDDTPVLVKLSPDLPDDEMETLCGLVRESRRITGVVLTNTSRKLAETLGSAVGGLSGGPLRSRSLDCVRRGRAALGPTKTLIGVGGVFEPAHMRELLGAGADLVEVYTGFVYKGPKLISRLKTL